jgi:hypothetical protein
MSVSRASQFLEKRIEKTLIKPALDSNSSQNLAIIADSEVRRYILFYSKHDDNSLEALEKLKLNKVLYLDTFLQNAATLGAKRPWWLEGVPTLFDKSTSSLLTGSSCIEFIEQYKKPSELFRIL